MSEETLYRIAFIGWSGLDGIFRREDCLLTEEQEKEYELLKKQAEWIAKQYAIKTAKENNRYTKTEFHYSKIEKRPLLLDDYHALLPTSLPMDDKIVDLFKRKPTNIDFIFPNTNHGD